MVPLRMGAMAILIAIVTSRLVDAEGKFIFRALLSFNIV